MARDFLCIQLAFYHDLGGDAGMIGARNPGGIVAAHTVVTGQAIHDGLIERMSHVQGAGNVRWRQLNTERGFVRVDGRGKVTALFPFATPGLFDFRRLK